jgi:hypothetical protein
MRLVIVGSDGTELGITSGELGDAIAGRLELPALATRRRVERALRAALAGVERDLRQATVTLDRTAT